MLLTTSILKATYFLKWCPFFPTFTQLNQRPFFIGVFFSFEDIGWFFKMFESVQQKCGHTIDLVWIEADCNSLAHSNSPGLPCLCISTYWIPSDPSKLVQRWFSTYFYLNSSFWNKKRSWMQSKSEHKLYYLHEKKKVISRCLIAMIAISNPANVLFGQSQSFF